MKFLMTLEITINDKEWNDALEIRKSGSEGIMPLNDESDEKPITDAMDVATEFGLGLKTAFAPETLEDRIWEGNGDLYRCLGDLVMVSVNSCEIKTIE